MFHALSLLLFVSILHAVTRSVYILTMTDIHSLRACNSHVHVGKPSQQSSAYEVVPGWLFIAPGTSRIVACCVRDGGSSRHRYDSASSFYQLPPTERFQRRPQLVPRFFSYDDQGISNFDVSFGELALFPCSGLIKLVQKPCRFYINIHLAITDSNISIKHRVGGNMAKARGRRLLLGLLMLANMAVSSPLLTIPSANDVSDVGSDWSHTLRLSNSRTTSIKCSGFDEQYYEERGALDSQSSSSEEDNEEYDGTGIHAALNRAKQENDGEEGTNGDEQKASWQICVKRGNALMTLFGEPQIPKTEQSKFSAYSDLQKYGWTLEEKPFDPIAEDKFLIDPLDEINVAYDPKSGAKTWQRLVFTHDQETMGALGERIISVKVWSEQPNDDEWFKNYGPLLHMLFELSDAALVNDGPGAAEMSVQGVQEPLGPTMPQGSWSKPPAPIAEGQEDVTVQPSFSGGSAKSDARSIREDTMRRSEAQSSVGSRQNTDRSSRFHGGSRPSRRSRYRRNRRCSIKDHDQEDLDESRFPRQNEEEALHLLSEHDGGKNEADRSIMPSNRKLRQRDQSLPEDGGSRLQNRDDGSDAVSSCTERNEAPQANTVLRKLVRRMEPGPSSQPARFVPQPGERLPFVQSSASSPSQLTGYSFSAGPGPRPGQSFDSYVFKRAQEDGFYWIKRLGSDTLSPEDESQVPAMYDQGDYGYELDESWQLPREPLGFKGLGTLVPGFYDPQGRPNQDWTPMRWVHENQWVDDEDFKHHPVSHVRKLY